MMSRWNRVVVAGIGLMFSVCAPGWSDPGKVKQQPEDLYTRSPYYSADDQYLKTIYTRPYESKGLPPVTLTFLEDVEPLILAENGVAKAKIIIPPDSLYYTDVAQMLKSYLDLATGADFEIVADGDADVRGIYVGPLNNAASKAVFKRAQELDLDGFIIQSFDKGIIIAGRDGDPLHGIKNNLKPKYRVIRSRNHVYVRGTYMGMIDFMERFVGIRRYSAGYLGAYFPDLTNRKVVVPAVRYQDSPVFKYRCWHGGHAGYDAKYLKSTYREGDIWCTYRRSSAATGANGNHTDCLWHEFYMDQPEYFAMRKDGTRMMGHKGDQSSQRCYTSEAGFQQHIKNIDEWYKHGDRTGKEYRTFTRAIHTPNDKYIYWMPNDGFPGCFCPSCKALVAKYDKKYHPKLVQELHYLGKLAREAQKRWPGKVINYDLYGRKDIPAEFNLPKNICLTKVFNSYCEAYWKEDKYLDFAQGLINKLNELSTEKTLIWSHYPIKPRHMCDINMPYMVPHVLSDFYRKNRNNISGTYINLGAITWAHDTYILYLYQSLLWNPETDPDELLAEFCSTLFGPASREMQEYFDILIDRWENVKWSFTPDVIVYGGASLCKTFPAQLYWTETYPRDVRDQLEALLATAMARTEPDTIYHKRMLHYTGATEEFFEQGKTADSGTSTRAECPPTASPPIIDGNLSEWKNATALVLKECMTGKEATLKTEFFTTHDKNNIYFAGKVHEPDSLILPDKKGAPLHEYDSVEIFFSPDQLGDEEAGFNKRNRFYQVILNGRGDIFRSRKKLRDAHASPFDFTVDYAVKPMGNGFQFEMSVPYDAINAMTPEPGNAWPANFYRNRKRDDGSERYYGWAPTMGKPFFYSRKFGELEFPKPLLYTVALSNLAAWRKNAPEAETSCDFKDGIATVRVKYPKSASGPTSLSFFTGGPHKETVTPISIATSIRYNGVGARKINFWARAENWDRMEQSFNPAADATQRVTTKDWRNIRIDKAFRPSPRRTKIEKLNDFYSSGLGITILPGADFVIEVKPVKVYEK